MKLAWTYASLDTVEGTVHVDFVNWTRSVQRNMSSPTAELCLSSSVVTLIGRQTSRFHYSYLNSDNNHSLHS